MPRKQQHDPAGTVTTTIRLPSDLHAMVQDVATAYGGSVNGELVRRVRESFQSSELAPQLDRIERQLGVITTVLLEQQVSKRKVG